MLCTSHACGHGTQKVGIGEDCGLGRGEIDGQLLSRTSGVGRVSLRSSAGRRGPPPSNRQSSEPSDAAYHWGGLCVRACVRAQRLGVSVTGLPPPSHCWHQHSTHEGFGPGRRPWVPTWKTTWKWGMPSCGVMRVTHSHKTMPKEYCVCVERERPPSVSGHTATRERQTAPASAQAKTGTYHIALFRVFFASEHFRCSLEGGVGAQ